MSRFVREVMKTDVVKISPETTVPEIQREFLRARVGALPVVGSDGSLQGIVSRSDVVRQQSVEQSLVELSSSGFD
ncbi:MAG TPA: CBS domain-containing protein, partial [Myxococcota bacterium]|nr:CBS domain-containing protein [Myxococcota bacterium]